MATEPAHRLRERDHLAALPLNSAAAAARGIRVFVVDERPLCRKGLAVMLCGEGGFEWAGEAADTASALSLAPPLAPDVFLIEHRMPAIDGVAAILALRQLCPQARQVLVADHLDAADVRRAVQAGASCVLHQSVGTTDLVLSLRAVHSGQRVVTAAMAAALDEAEREAQSRNELTRRELALLELMALGMENRAIAAELNIAVPTVKFHITNIMSKLHAPNRTAAVLVALRHGLVDLHRKAAVAAGS